MARLKKTCECAVKICRDAKRCMFERRKTNHLRCNCALLSKCAADEDSVLRNGVEARCIIDPNPINVNEGARLGRGGADKAGAQRLENPELRSRPGHRGLKWTHRSIRDDRGAVWSRLTLHPAKRSILTSNRAFLAFTFLQK